MALSVSCIIMAYNEEATLEEAIRDVVEALAAFGDRAFEVLVVDDGSTDRTPAIARRLAGEHPEVRVITHPVNRGPGSAIVTGFAQAKNEVVCFHPADQQLRFAEVAATIPLLDDHDLVVGIRTGRPGYSVLRRLSSQTYIALVHLLFGLRELEDFNYVYLYRKALLERIDIQTSGVFMTTEVLVKAEALGARIIPATITCLPRLHGQATCGSPRVIAHTFREMVGFWWRWRRAR